MIRGIITPNRKEFLEMNPYPKNIEYTLKTLGKDGIKIINNFKTMTGRLNLPVNCKTT